MKRAVRSVLKRGSIRVAVLLVFVVLLSASSGVYAGASFFAQQAPNVTVTTTILTTTTSWTTSTAWSTVTAVIYGVWTTVQYTTSTSTVTVTGSTITRAPKSVTAYGNARITTAQSKFGGASGLFNGNGAYLSTPDSADWYFGTGDFTVEMWVKKAENGRAQFLIAQGTLVGAGTNSFIINFNADNTITVMVDNGVALKWANTAALTDTASWHHIALIRYGTNLYAALDGTLSAATDLGTGYSVRDDSHALKIGIPGDYFSPTGLYFNGWIDELRVSKGVARWTSNFTPSTSAPAGDSYTVLLLHMDGADGSNTFIDG